MAGEIPGAKVVHRLAPGVFSIGDELHVDLEEFMLSLGWDPRDEREQEKAVRIVASFAEDQGIPLEVELDAGGSDAA